MDFSIQVFGGLRITENITLLITETTISTWIVGGLLILFAVIVRIKSRKWTFEGKPSGLQNVVEFIIDGFDGFFRRSGGEKVRNLAPWFFTLFVFLFVSNAIGVIGIRPPTADWGMTFPLAISSFVLIQYAGVRHRPKSYLRGIFLEPAFVFAPINILGELAKPLALSFRLFGNILAGMVMLSLSYAIVPYAVSFLLPVPLHMYFDIASGLLQAFIFTVLSITFVGLAAEE